jgi:hypothetical protein
MQKGLQEIKYLMALYMHCLFAVIDYIIYFETQPISKLQLKY